MLATRQNIKRGVTNIASLHKDCARPSEFAHKAFTSSQVADNTAGRNTLERVFAIPRDQMSVVDDVLLAFAELQKMQKLATCLTFFRFAQYSRLCE
jgi:hypothetical protein